MIRGGRDCEWSGRRDLQRARRTQIARGFKAYGRWTDERWGGNDSKVEDAPLTLENVWWGVVTGDGLEIKQARGGRGDRS